MASFYKKINYFFFVFFIAFSLLRFVSGDARPMKQKDVENPSKSKYKYQLAVVAIFHNDARYLKEWIEFHRLVGVEHFYLYNHLSTDAYKEVLKPYIAKGIVKLIDWPYTYGTLYEWNQIQRAAYGDALTRAKGKVKWLAAIDTDEFIFPSQENSLLEFLSSYEQYGGLGINWVVFGTSGVHLKTDTQLLTEELTLRGPDNSPMNLHIKSIVRPERVAEAGFDPHAFIYKKGYGQVNANKEPFSGPFSPYVAIDKVRINHYCYRDEDYFHQVKIPRLKKWGVDTSNIENAIQAFNVVVDPSINKYLPKLRAKVFPSGFE